MEDLKPNSDRRIEGEQGTEASAPEQAPKTGRSTRSSRAKSASDKEPGPNDDDGLPENAKRRVPS